MVIRLDKSNPVGRIKYRARWYLRTRKLLPKEVGLRAAPEIRLRIKRPETGNFVLAAKKKYGLDDNLLIFEPAETSVFLKRLGRAEIFYDIGAHIGYYSLIAASYSNIKRVIAMDVLSDFAREVSFHSKTNGLNNILVEPVALGDGTTHIEFGNRLSRKKQKTIGLDEYIAAKGLQPDLIKVDIEGYENLALRGAAKTLQASPDLMLSIHPKYLTLQGERSEDLLKMLRANFKYLYLIDSRRPAEDQNLSETLKEIQLDRVPDDGFTIWCSEEPLL